MMFHTQSVAAIQMWSDNYCFTCTCVSLFFYFSCSIHILQ